MYKVRLRLYRNGNAADFCPDSECRHPGGSGLGGSDVIATQMEQVDLIRGLRGTAGAGREI
jgi:hypothetical protein